MDIEQLQQTLQDERNSERLQPISDSFYTDVSLYIEELREERDTLAAEYENVFNAPDAMEVNYKIQRTETTLERIYNRRIGKLISQSVLAVSGGTFDTSALTEIERTLYETFISAVNTHRADALSVLENSTPHMSLTEPQNTGTVSDIVDKTESQSSKNDAETDSGIAEYMGSGPTDDAPPEQEHSSGAPGPTTGTQHPGGFAEDLAFGEDTSSTPTEQTDTDPHETTDGGTEEVLAGTEDFAEAFEDTPEEDTTLPTERITVRILKDVGEVYGVDERTYELAKDDVVTLPEQNAQPLVTQNAAVPLD